MTFAALVQRFFADYLARQRNLSAHTIRAYRHTFRLLLPFLSLRRRTPVDLLSFADFTSDTVMEFLDHLERERHNAVRSRNARLAAIRSFARFCLGQSAPDLIESCRRILSLPAKRCDHPVLGFMNRAEIAAVLAAIPHKTWSGQRDHVFFSLLYNTGARVSEVLQLRPDDVQPRALILHGKGRKDRTVPIWRQTAQRLRHWITSNQIRSDQAIFTNHRGEPLTREGVAFRLGLIVRTAVETCATLRGKHITPHTFRHTAAMHLLQSGVALEVIALWLGHERPLTTHGYVEADLKMKQDCIDQLDRPHASRPKRAKGDSRLLAFLEAV
jgi:integrase/recombinase XerD